MIFPSRLSLMLTVLGGLMSLASLAPASADELGKFVIGNYHLVSSIRISRMVFEYVFEADITASTDNSSGDGFEVTATVASQFPATTVGDHRLSFGQVPPGSTVTSKDTFTIRQDLRIPFDASALLWNPVQVRAAESAPKNLTNSLGIYDACASWSPDGSTIAFMSTSPNRSGDQLEVFTMSLDGSKLFQVTHEAAFGQDAVCPKWSPDGSRIAYTSGSQIFTILDTGAGRTQLTFDGFNSLEDWSPDGSQLLFTAIRGSERFYYSIYVMNANGTGQTRLTHLTSLMPGGVFPGHSGWSSDGTLIVFVAIAPSPRGNEIYTIAPNGAAQTCLTCSYVSGNPEFPRFNRYTLDMPVSKRIAFTQKDVVTGTHQLFVMEQNGKNLKQLASAGGLYGLFDWKLNDDFIVYNAFAINEYGVPDEYPSLFVVNAYGKGVPRRLTAGLFVNTQFDAPAWSPDGSLILFDAIKLDSVKKNPEDQDIWTVNAP